MWLGNVTVDACASVKDMLAKLRLFFVRCPGAVSSRWLMCLTAPVDCRYDHSPGVTCPRNVM
jgi:hypothetical protein